MAPVSLSLGAGCLVSSLDTFQDPRKVQKKFLSDFFFQIHKPEPSPLPAASIWCIFLCLERSVIDDSPSVFITHITLYHQGFILTLRVVGTFLCNDHRLNIFINSNKLHVICFSNPLFTLDKGSVMVHTLAQYIRHLNSIPRFYPYQPLLLKATLDVRYSGKFSVTYSSKELIRFMPVSFTIKWY